MEPGEVYEVRYGPTLKNVALLLGAAVLTRGCSVSGAWSSSPRRSPFRGRT